MDYKRENKYGKIGVYELENELENSINYYENYYDTDENFNKMDEIDKKHFY